MKIGVSGTFSVGKTTFINELKQSLPSLSVIDEAARELINEGDLNVNNMKGKALSRFQTNVVQRQVKNELSTPTPWITDTALSDTLAYAKDAPNCEWIVDYVASYYNRRAYDIIFYIPPEIPLEDDGIRHTDEEYRTTIDERIVPELYHAARNHWIKVVGLTGSVKERVELALSAIESL